jgi:acyl-CoA synthetase (AMP-forming)/AMP-acid ligase II
MMLGFIGPPELTALSFVDGWYRTGDLGHHDDGCFYLSSRQKDVVRRRAKNSLPGMRERLRTG